MPQTLSAKKSLRKDRRRTALNLGVRRQVKEAVLKARKKPTPQNLQKATKILDRAAQKGVIHQNKASRLKSRLTKLLKKTRKQKTSPVKRPKKNPL